MPQIATRVRAPLVSAVVFAALHAFSAAGQQIVVTTLADSGPGSLREALLEAINDGVPSAIAFDASLAGGTIVPLSELPHFDAAETTLDGDLGGDCVPDIAIDGSAAGAAVRGLSVFSSGNVIRGLAIHSFAGEGIVIAGNGNSLSCNFLGANLELDAGLGNGADGLSIAGGASGNIVGPGNRILNNGASGLAVSDGMIPDAYPGFDGLTADAVAVFPVLDFEDGEGGFESIDGIRPLDGSGAPFLDEIGLRLSGTLTVTVPGTYTIAVDVDDQVRVLVDGGVVHSANNGQSAVEVALSGAHAFEIDFLEGCGWAHLVIGVTGPGAAALSTDGAVDGACPAGQSGLCGELFQLRVPSEGNTITASSIYDNGWLGIDLGACGGPSVAMNDAGDLDQGPNTFLNHPEIASVVSAGGDSYLVSGTAPPDSTVEVFVAAADPLGHGEGRLYLGAAAASAGGDFAANVELSPGWGLLTATATDAAGNTSEFGPNFTASDGQDRVTLGSPFFAPPGATVVIPVYVLDASLTALGVDRLAGERIQGLSAKVVFAPAGPVASKLLSRAGITAALTPTLEAAPVTATTASYLGYFDETTQPIPFTLDAAPPGDQVLQLSVTLAASAPAGPIELTLDPATTALVNEAGTLDETSGNGWLTLSGATLEVLSNAAVALRALATSSGSIELYWGDPTANETGFRLERRTDGESWTPIATLGPDDGGYIDSSGLAPATLYSYRLVTLVPADSHVSNVAAAATWPAVAAKVCPQAVAAPPRSWAFVPSAVWDGGAWGVAWNGREGATQDEIWFRRFDATSLAPLGPPMRVSGSANPADRVRWIKPVLTWNGSNYGVLWDEGLPGEPGTPLANTTFFALLDGSGSAVRNRVRLTSASDNHPWEDGLPVPLEWDGTNWGFFDLSVVTPPMLDLVYRRLDGDGDVVLGPVTVRAPAGAHVSDVAAAWNGDPGTSKYGVLWHEIRDDQVDVYFQVMEEATGALEGSPTHLDDYVSVIGTYGGSVAADGTGWAVVWVDAEIDAELNEWGVTWMRRFDPAGAPLGPAVRISSEPPNDGGLPLLRRKPNGSFALFGYCPSAPREICRLEVDADGTWIGTLTQVTPSDGANSFRLAVADNGEDFLVAFEDRRPDGYELGAVLVPVDDLSTPGPAVPLTAGHEANWVLPAAAGVAPLGAGFAAVWLDPTRGFYPIQARIWNGAGEVVADLSPLTPTPALSRPAVLGVGDELAMAWVDASGVGRWFARFDASGAPLLAETSISTVGTASGIAMDFTGESYGLLWRRGGGFNFVLVAADGALLVADRLVPVGGVAGSPAPQMRWTGAGFAVVWRAWDNSLHYSFLAPDGTPLLLDTQLTTPTQDYPEVAFHLIWTGEDLGLAWSEVRRLDPPLDEIYFVRLGPDGSLAFPPVTAVSTPGRDLNPLLYWTGSDTRFHLVHSAGGIAGAREIELQADGAVLPGERYWTNRDPLALAWNGVTLGLLFREEGNLWFETGECVTADSTAPPCPALTVGSYDEVVRLEWDAVDDPESGILRYKVERDGLPVGQTPAPTTLFDDPGFEIGATHAYQVRALNGAWDESDACPEVSYSTTAGDANGDGVYGVADIFYLINFFFADGPPPAGNADANGDNNVSVTDIFYLINDLFGEGPPPVPRGQVVTVAAAWEGDSWLESARVPGGGGSTATSWLVVGSGSAAPGHTVRIPIDLYDMPGTPLGPERPFGERIQALALHVRCAPCDGVAALAVEPAGALAAAQPTFQSRPAGPGSAALIASYDEAASPLFAAAPSVGSRQRVGWVVVRLTEMAAPGSSFEIRLDPGTTTLSNDGGTRFETVGNGWLRLRDGRVGVGAPRRLEWR